VQCRDGIFQCEADGTGQRLLRPADAARGHQFRIHEDMTCARERKRLIQNHLTVRGLDV